MSGPPRPGDAATSPDTLALGPGREFDVVRGFVQRWGELAAGIGGDCAVLDVPPGERLVVSTDTSVEDVHFRRAWLTPHEIAHRATTAALSDLAAAAARPLGLLLALAVPPGWQSDLDALADGVASAARAAGAPILGGDLTSAAALALTVTVLGSARAPLERRGAVPGQALYVTGRLGGPATALRAWMRGATPHPAHRARFATPVARVAEARWLAEQGATAAVDLSDGLAADARHLAAASGVALWLDVDAVPLIEGASLADGLAGGEEYELLVAAGAALDVHAFAARFGVPLTRVGRVLAGGAPEVSARVDLPRGHDHFSA